MNATGERLTDGRYACAPCKVLGTHQGPIGKVTPTGRFVVVHAIVYAELTEHGGLLLRARAFFDAWGAATGLGVLPKPAPRANARFCCCAASGKKPPNKLRG